MTQPHASGLRPRLLLGVCGKDGRRPRLRPLLHLQAPSPAPGRCGEGRADWAGGLLGGCHDSGGRRDAGRGLPRRRNPGGALGGDRGSGRFRGSSGSGGLEPRKCGGGCGAAAPLRSAAAGPGPRTPRCRLPGGGLGQAVPSRQLPGVIYLPSPARGGGGLGGLHGKLHLEVRGGRAPCGDDVLFSTSPRSSLNSVGSLPDQSQPGPLCILGRDSGPPLIVRPLPSSMQGLRRHCAPVPGPPLTLARGRG